MNLRGLGASDFPIARKRLVAISVLLAIGFGTFAYALIAPTISFDLFNGQGSGSKVLIADQLDLSRPNETFRKNVESIFQTAKTKYDVVIGKDITISYYRTLPSMGYRLILLRVHSGLLQPPSPGNPVYLFSGEPYSTSKYQEEQLSGALTPAAVTISDPVYFAISPSFIAGSMNGTFQGTVLLLSGCSALINTHLADAFLSRGASAVISWDEFVSAAHTDLAFNHLIEDFVSRGMTIEQSVQDTMDKVGPDPYYQSNLRFYPGNAASTKFADLLSSNWPRSQTATATSSQTQASLGDSFLSKTGIRSVSYHRFPDVA